MERNCYEHEQFCTSFPFGEMQSAGESLEDVEQELRFLEQRDKINSLKSCVIEDI